MALPPTIYRARVALSDLDRHCYATLNATLARHPSETADRLVARLLAYALWYEEDLTFTKGICAGDEPDLWVKGPDGRVTLWIEVGLPDPERLLKASRHAGQAVLLAHGKGLERWEATHLSRLANRDNLQVVALDQAFVEALVALLQRGIDWSLTVTEGTLYLETDGAHLETQLRPLTA